MTRRDEPPEHPDPDDYPLTDEGKCAGCTGVYPGDSLTGGLCPACRAEREADDAPAHGYTGRVTDMDDPRAYGDVDEPDHPDVDPAEADEDR